MTRINRISVIGGGLMGHGIALTFARAGLDVVVQDPAAEMLQSLATRIHDSLIGLGEADTTAILQRVKTSISLGDAVKDADLVIEAAPEKPALKQAIFAELELSAPEHCILASNTSVIPITTIVAGLKSRHRALGTHWWNPPHMIPLVEVIRTEWTDDASMDAVVEVLERAGKTPARVEKDVPGFIGNRLQHALWREAISLVENGICSAETVDDVVKASFGRRLAVLGPLENADLVGTELTLDIHQQILSDLDASQAPSPYLKNLVRDGKLGMKSGEGFRKWADGDLAMIKNRIASHLRKLEGILSDQSKSQAQPKNKGE